MPDTILALVNRSRLSVVLTAFHREGFGHVTRVLDPERSPLVEQLHRAGVENSRLAGGQLNDTVLLFAHVPMRTTAAAALAVAHGAHDVEVVTCGRAATVPGTPRLTAVAGARRDRRASRYAEAIPESPTGTHDSPVEAP
jgi:hypothetical protein